MALPGSSRRACNSLDLFAREQAAAPKHLTLCSFVVVQYAIGATCMEIIL